MRQVQKHDPDVVILDVRLNCEDGFHTLARMRRKWPDLPVLMWSTSENPTYIARSRALGANGFLPRGLERRELTSTIRSATKKEHVWTDEQIDATSGCPEIPKGVDLPLTPREREVLRQLAYGLPNKEIALSLGISYETVKEHIQHILRKLNAVDRTQAAVWAVRNKLD